MPAPTTEYDQLYDLFPTLSADDPRKHLLASASPLLLAMHLDPNVEAFPHMRIMDQDLLALCNLNLYPDGPGPAPEVYGRKEEKKGKYVLLGHGYTCAISDEAYNHDEVFLCRPGSFDPETQETTEVDDNDLISLKIAISLPPRHGKSLIATETLPMWFLLRYPDNSVVVSTYNQDFADTWGKNLQDKLEEKGHLLPLASDGHPLIPLTQTLALMSFRPGKDRGQIVFRGAGKSLTGTGWGLGIIDDPFKDQSDAMSEVQRKEKHDWYTSVFSGRRTNRRGSPPPLEVMIFTRWHEDDLAGRFAYQEDGESPQRGWRVLRMPAISEGPAEYDALNRAPGMSLCPRLAALSFLESEREKDPTWFSCLYQGRPTHATGNMFAKTFDLPDGGTSYHHHRRSGPESGSQTHWLYLDKDFRAKDLMFFITVDTAASKKTSADWTVASLWGFHKDERTLLLLDRKRERVSTESHRAWIMEFYNRVTHVQGRRVEFVGIENKTFGTNLLNELRMHEPSVVLMPIPADKDKVTNAIPYSEAVKAGKCLFPHPDTCFWSVEWENEHARFPRGTKDDQVDTGSMAWTVAQRYAYTPREIQPPPPPTLHQKSSSDLRKKQQGRVHDYDRLRNLIP